MSTALAGSVSFQWYFNSTPIDGATDDTLTVRYTNYADTGTYYCTIKDACGELKSETARIIIPVAQASVPSASADLRYFTGSPKAVIYGRSISVDKDRNTYTAGTFTDTAQFDYKTQALLRAAQPDAGGKSQSDVFVIKHSASQKPLWVLQFENAVSDGDPDIVTDSKGFSYICFGFKGTIELKIQGKMKMLTPIGAGIMTNAFLKIDTDGNVVWAYTLGGGSLSSVQKLDITADDKIIYMGMCNKAKFDADFSPLVVTVGNGTTDGAFIAVYDTDAKLQWVRSLQVSAAAPSSSTVKYQQLAVDNYNGRILAYASATGAVQYSENGQTLDLPNVSANMLVEYDIESGKLTNTLSIKGAIEIFFDMAFDVRGNLLLLLRTRKAAFDCSILASESNVLPTYTNEYQTHLLKYSSSYKYFGSRTIGAFSNNVSHKVFTDDYTNVYISHASGYSIAESNLLGADAKRLTFGGHLLGFNPDLSLLMDKHIYATSTASFYDAVIIDNKTIAACGIYQEGNAHLNPDQPNLITPENSGYSGFMLSLPVQENVYAYPCEDFTVNLGIDSLLCEGQSLQLKPVYLPEFPLHYKWSTGQTTPSIDVTSSGKYYVTVSSVDMCKPSVDSITVSTVSLSVGISVPKAQVAPRSIFAFEAVPADAYKEYRYVWQSLMPLQSSFGAYALFRAPVSGSHPVRLIAIDQLSGCTAQANTTFTVSSTPVGLTGISLYETSANVLVGGTLQLHAFPQPFNADISGLIWESADTAVATVADGVVTGLAVGSALIKVFSADKTAANTIKVTVSAKVPAQSLQLPKSIALVSGTAAELRPVLFPAGATTEGLTWMSSDAAVVRVSDNGTVSGLALGSAVVTVKAIGTGLSASTFVTVTSKAVVATGILLPERLQLSVGTSVRMPYSLIPYNATVAQIAWSTDNDSVVQFIAGAQFTIIGSGTATVTATVNGTNSSCAIVAGSSLPPQILNLPDVFLTLDGGSKTINLADYVSDDSTARVDLKFNISSAKNVFARLSGAELFVNPTAASVPGYETITLTVTDEELLQSTKEIGIYLFAKGTAPQATVVLPDIRLHAEKPSASIDVAHYISPKAILNSVTAIASDNISVSATGTKLQFSLKENSWIGTDSIVVSMALTDGQTLVRKIAIHAGALSNKAPIVGAIPAQVGNESTAFRLENLNLYVQDDYTVPEDISWSVSSSPYFKIDIVNNAFRVQVADIYWTGRDYVWFIAEDEAGLKDSALVSLSYKSSLVSAVARPNVFAVVAQKYTVTPNEEISLWVDMLGQPTESTEYVWEIDGAIFADGETVGTSVAVSFPEAGKYSVSLKAVSASGVKTVYKKDFISVLGISPRDVRVCYGQSAVLSYSGFGGETLLWSTCESGTEITVKPTQTTKYSVKIIAAKSGVPFYYADEVTVDVAVPVYIGADTSICQGTAYKILPKGYEQYAWTYNGSSVAGNEISISKAGFYGLTATDSYGCKSEDELVVTRINPLPQVSLKGAPSICLGDTLWLDAGNFAAYKWSNGVSAQQNPLAATGNYSVTVTDNNGCINSADFDLYVQSPYVEQLGMATVDSTGEYVLVAWERTRNRGTAYYELFRIAYNDTLLIAKLPFDSLSVVIDTTAKINKQAYRYLLRTTDTCGHSSDYSPYHQTIYLVAKPEMNSGGVALNWTSYEGLPVSGYLIYRLLDGELVKIADAASFENGFTVSPHAYGAKYRVGVNLPKCTPTTLKNESGPFSQSMSNLSEAIMVGFAQRNKTGMLVYPNPTDGLFGVVIDGDGSQYSIVVTDQNGTEVLRYQGNVSGAKIITVNIQDKPAGLYHIVLNVDGRRTENEIVKY